MQLCKGAAALMWMNSSEVTGSHFALRLTNGDVSAYPSLFLISSSIGCSMIVSKTPQAAWTRLVVWKDINYQMHQSGASGQIKAECRHCLDATYPMQKVGMIWIATYGWEVIDVY